MALVFFLPKPPDIANGRASWQKVLREKRQYFENLNARMRAKHGFPEKPAAPLARARASITWHFALPQHRPDADNAIRRMKYVMDFLVAHEFIAGDSPDYLTWASPSYEHEFKGMPPLTTVRLILTPK